MVQLSIGVPKEIKDADGRMYLDLVRPKIWANDEVDALFIDEYNRAEKKVRNAVMELIQFKSINGQKFKNLKIVWAAINPEDDESNEYDVEPLDPAQKDRFHIKVEIPYQCSLEYFTDKFDKHTAQTAIAWWTDLPAEIKNKVSPRRLDYALEIHQLGGDLKYVLPEESNIKLLVGQLKSSPVEDTLTKFQQKQDKEGARKWLAIENNFNQAINSIMKRANKAAFFIPLMPEEKIAMMIASNETAKDVSIRLSATSPEMKNIINNIIENGQNQALVDELKAKTVVVIPPTNVVSDIIVNPKAEKFTAKLTTNNDYANDLKLVEGKPFSNTFERFAVMNTLQEKMPGSVDKNESFRTLTLLDMFVNRSRSGTVRVAVMLIPMANHCIEHAILNGVEVDELMQKFGDLMKYLVGCPNGYLKYKNA